MRYKLIGSNNVFSPIETILHNRGIKDTNKYLDAQNNINVTHNFFKLKNIDKAVACITYHIKNNSNIWLNIDPDCDGLLSSAMFINYLKQIKSDINIKWRNQKGKEHRLEAKHVPNDINLVVSIDSGTNNINQHKKLKNRGIDTVIIDHHEIEKVSEYAIVVNNQDGQYPNTDLSATGVLYRVLQALDKELGVNYANNYLDMTAIGIIGDMMELITKENRYLITQGLKNIQNPFLKELYKEQEFSTKGLINPTTTSFYIVPLFNAVIRTGTMEEKNQLFETLLDDGTTEVYYKRGDTYEPLITNTIRMMKRVRNQQNKIVDESVEKIEKRIKQKNLLDNKILIVEVSGLLDDNYTGLVANRLLNGKEVMRPVLLLRYDEQDNTLKGSGRGYDKGYIKDFRQFLLDSGYFEWVNGHANAFGNCIKKDKLIEFNKYVNEKYKDVDFGSSEYEVDFILQGGSVPKDIVRVIDENHFLWGRGVEEPLIAIENVQIERRNISFIGKQQNHMKFTYDGVEYIKFYIDDKEKEKILQGGEMDTVVMNIIARASVNEWRGRKTSQFIIEEYEISETKERDFIF